MPTFALVASRDPGPWPLAPDRTEPPKSASERMAVVALLGASSSSLRFGFTEGLRTKPRELAGISPPACP